MIVEILPIEDVKNIQSTYVDRLDVINPNRIVVLVHGNVTPYFFKHLKNRYKLNDSFYTVILFSDYFTPIREITLERFLSVP